MANTKSAKKRDRQQESRRIRNRLIVGRMRTALKEARASIASDTPSKDIVLFAVHTIDRAVSKGVLKRKTGSRLISRLTRNRKKTT